MMKRIKKLKKEYPKSKCWKIPNKNVKKCLIIIAINAIMPLRGLIMTRKSMYYAAINLAEKHSSLNYQCYEKMNGGLLIYSPKTYYLYEKHTFY